jgi:hypothetical protein
MREYKFNEINTFIINEMFSLLVKYLTLFVSYLVLNNILLYW